MRAVFCVRKMINKLLRILYIPEKSVIFAHKHIAEIFFAEKFIAPKIILVLTAKGDII